MNPLLSNKRPDLEALCQRHRVERLEVFGSAARESGGAAPNDLDFLVVFEECSPSEHAGNYLGLLAGLQDLFECEIDLVELSAVRNPHFRRGIESTRAVVYAA